MSEKQTILSDADVEFGKFKDALKGLSKAQMSRHHYQAHREDIAAWRSRKGI